MNTGLIISGSNKPVKPSTIPVMQMIPAVITALNLKYKIQDSNPQNKGNHIPENKRNSLIAGFLLMLIIISVQFKL